MGGEGAQPHPSAPGPIPERSNDPDAAELFELVWATMADILGTAATAALLRRAARRAELPGVTIAQDGLTYRFQVPASWHQPPDPASLAPLRHLVRELCPLLEEMTGPVVLCRLGRVAPLQRVGFTPRNEVQA